MFIIMHCMGMPFDGATVAKRSLGGSETAAYYVAKGLAEKGHRVTLFTNINKESECDGVRYVPNGEITQESPLGQNFHWYATQTPHDICIIQRHPQAFAYHWASKINLWWLHDVALYRHKDAVTQMSWNIDGVLTVSNHHKKQVCDVYDLDPDIAYVINNGVDLSLFSNKKKTGCSSKPYQLFYSSRPERGLENLVEPGGIMEKLGKDYELSVCAYENTTPQMEDYYAYLWSRCDEMENVTNLGSLTKEELAKRMQLSDVHVYPTEFEEVSCITAMEAAAAGLPFISIFVFFGTLFLNALKMLIVPLVMGRVATKFGHESDTSMKDGRSTEKSF